MFLIVFALLGFLVGFQLEMTRAGYLTMALTSVAIFAGEIFHVLTTTNRAALTIMPIVIGFILVAFMLVGALAHLGVRCLKKPQHHN